MRILRFASASAGRLLDSAGIRIRGMAVDKATWLLILLTGV